MSSCAQVPDQKKLCLEVAACLYHALVLILLCTGGKLERAHLEGGHPHPPQGCCCSRHWQCDLHVWGASGRRRGPDGGDRRAGGLPVLGAFMGQVMDSKGHFLLTDELVLSQCS
eukprot:scaffold246552_cov17-Tisochrysis_lutea.AAC.1